MNRRKPPTSTLHFFVAAAKNSSSKEKITIIPKHLVFLKILGVSQNQYPVVVQSNPVICIVNLTDIFMRLSGLCVYAKVQNYKVQVTRNERHAKKRLHIRFQTKLYAIILLFFEVVTFDFQSVVILVFMSLAIGGFVYALKQFVFAQKDVLLPLSLLHNSLNCTKCHSSRFNLADYAKNVMQLTEVFS